MNVVDEFFASPRWEEAIRQFLPRRKELKRQQAVTAFRRLAREVQHSRAATMVLRKYADFLDLIATGDDSDVIYNSIQEFARTNPPKLVREDLLALAKVKNEASAKQFCDEHTEVWHELLVSQWIRGETFWQLLLASAETVQRTDPSGAAEFVKTTLLLGNEGERHRVFKVLPLSDGGFAVTAPYHAARAGSLIRTPILRQTGHADIPFDAIVPFHASDRVKLSYHWDGFVQFSGESSSRIVSGRDPETGEPRGLGLLAQPLDCPVQSGPCVGCSIWGLSDFQRWVERRAEKAILFEEQEDFYDEPVVGVSGAPETPGYSVSLFVLPTHVVEAAVGHFSTSDTLSMLLPMNIYHRRTRFRVKLLRVSRKCTLGVIAKRGVFGFEGSGFQLAGPNDGRNAMFAIYPQVAGIGLGRSLDFQPAGANP